MDDDIQIGILDPENNEDAQRVTDFVHRFEEGEIAYGVYHYAKTPDGQIVGYLRSNKKGDLWSTLDVHLQNIIAIDVIQIDPKHQGRGVGRRLVGVVEFDVRKYGIRGGEGRSSYLC